MKISSINYIASAICLAFYTTGLPISKSSDVDTISVLSAKPVYTINNEINAENFDITFKKKRSHRKVFAKGPKGIFKKVLSKDPNRIAAIKEEINNIDGEEISDTEDEAVNLNRRDVKKYRLKAGKGYRMRAGKGYRMRAGKGYRMRAGKGYRMRAGKGYRMRASKGYRMRASKGYRLKN